MVDTDTRTYTTRACRAASCHLLASRPQLEEATTAMQAALADVHSHVLEVRTQHSGSGGAGESVRLGEVSATVATLFLECIVSETRLWMPLPSSASCSSDRQWMLAILGRFRTRIPELLDSHALGGAAAAECYRLQHEPFACSLISNYITTTRESLRRLITNLCLREKQLFRDSRPLAAAASGSQHVHDSGCSEQRSPRSRVEQWITVEENGRVRTFLAADLLCLLEREVGMAARLGCPELHLRVLAACLETTLAVFEEQEPLQQEPGSGSGEGQCRHWQ